MELLGDGYNEYRYDDGFNWCQKQHKKGCGFYECLYTGKITMRRTNYGSCDYTIDSTKQAEHDSKKLQQATKEEQQQNSEKLKEQQSEIIIKNSIENKLKQQQAENGVEIQLSEQAKQYVEQQAELAVKSGIKWNQQWEYYFPTGETQKDAFDISKLDIFI